MRDVVHAVLQGVRARRRAALRSWLDAQCPSLVEAAGAWTGNHRERRSRAARSAESWTASTSDADEWGDGGLFPDSGGGGGGGGVGGGQRAVGESDGGGSGNRRSGSKGGGIMAWLFATSVIGGGVYFVGLERGGRFGSIVRLVAIWAWVLVRHGPKEVYSIVSQLLGRGAEGDIDALALEDAAGGGAALAPGGAGADDASDDGGDPGCVGCAAEEDGAASAGLAAGADPAPVEDAAAPAGGPETGAPAAAPTQENAAGPAAGPEQGARTAAPVTASYSAAVPPRASADSEDDDQAPADPLEACIAAKLAAERAVSVAKDAFVAASSASSNADLAVSSMMKNHHEDALAAAAEASEASKWAADFSSSALDSCRVARTIEKRAREFVDMQAREARRSVESERRSRAKTTRRDVDDESS